MLDLKIEKETYGLFLITSNVCDYLVEKDSTTDKRQIDVLKDSLNIEIMEKRGCQDKIHKVIFEHINSWTLLGIHDLAILVKSNSKLDQAITIVGESLNHLKEQTIKCPEFIKDEKTSKIFQKLVNISQEDKKIKIFDFWCEPLIPLYINDSIRENNNCIILYYRLNTTESSYENLLALFKENCKNISDGEVIAIFNGFGIFDLIFFVKFEKYSKIPQIINEIRLGFDNYIYESSSLICAPFDQDKDEKQPFPFSIVIKINRCIENRSIWTDIEELAQCIGITRICIEKIDKPMTVTFKQGFFDIVFIGHGTLNQFSEFCRLLESLPFIIDTATMLNLEVNYDLESRSDL